jgi:hypothetical protein
LEEGANGLHGPGLRFGKTFWGAAAVSRVLKVGAMQTDFRAANI